MNCNSNFGSISARTCPRGGSGVCRGDTISYQPVAFSKREPASRGFLLAAILLALPLVLHSPSYSQDSGKKSIRAFGAAGVASAVNTMAQAYAQKFPQCPSVLVVGSTTEKGFEGLLEGNADLVLAHREASSEEIRQAVEKNIDLGHKFLRNSGLAIITSSNNTLNQLTMQQLRGVFSGEYTNWHQIGGPDRPITVLIISPDAGPSTVLRQRVLGGASFAKHAVVLPSFRQVVDTCSKPGEKVYISYMPFTSAFFHGASGKMLKIVGLKKDDNSPAIVPSAQSLKDATYPITVSTHLYWDTKSTDKCMSDFIEFCAEMGRKGE